MEFEYVFDAWNRYLKENKSAVVLSDSLGSDLTRSQVDDISNRVYGWLKQNGIGTGDFVMINLDRGVKPVLAILGVLKAGAAFTLVESTYARDRIDFIRRDWNPGIEINELVWPVIIESVPCENYVIADDHDVCFGVYTSGTTGTLKGVLHEYGQLKMEMISERRKDGSWRENPGTRWGLVAPLNFVASLKIVIHFLYCGGHLYVMDYNTVKNPRKLTAYFFRNKINETFLSPSLIRLKGTDYGPFMRYMYTGSEPANNVSIRGAELNNTYTMSESFFTVCEFIIDKPYPVCPIGVPMFELDIKLIDEEGRIVAPGETGELCFYNPYCRGYINNDEENALHFIDGYFHTGDLAEFRDGQYILKGRRDDMIKIDGNRIEPSEIEAVCRELMGAPVCIAKGFESDGIVVLYYTGDIQIDANELKEKIAQRLPYYMIPSHFVHIDSVPLTQSGKLNRSVLKKPDTVVRAQYVAPKTDFERFLCENVEKVLGIKNVGTQDDFFDLGGSSIKVMELLSEMENEEYLTHTMIYEGRTIEGIAGLRERAVADHLTPDQKELEARKHRYPLSRNMKWYWDNVNDSSLDFYAGYMLSPIVPAKLIVARINRYIDANSTFNLILEEGEDGIPVQVYTGKKPYVRLEKMSESEVKELQNTFVRPFGYGEPLIRLRVIRAGLHTYLLFHAFHMITDGAGVHFIIEDMMKCIFGRKTDAVNYFAWAYDENQRDHSPVIEQNGEYFRNKYFEADWEIAIRSDENTGEKGSANTGKASVSLDAVRRYCREEKISVNNFLVAAALLAQSAYNRSSRNLVIWNFNNRGPRDNRAGMMVRASFCAIERDKIRNVQQLFEEITTQNENNLWRVHDYDYFMAFDKTGLMPDIALTYLEDWFSFGLPRIAGKDFPLYNSSPANEESEKFYCLACTHEKDQLCCSLQYGRSYLKEESAERYISMLEYAMKELIQGKLPQF